MLSNSTLKSVVLLSITMLALAAGLWTLVDREDLAVEESTPIAPKEKAAWRASPSLEPLDRSRGAGADSPSDLTSGKNESLAVSHEAPSLVGRVLGLDGAPVIDVVVATKSHSRSVVVGRTNGSGRFTSSQSVPLGARLEVADPAWVTIGEATIVPELDEAILVACPSVGIGGNVVDESGEAISGVELKVEIPNRLLRALDTNDATSFGKWTTKTDGVGGFLFERAPSFEGLGLRVSRSGYRTLRQEAPRAETLDLTITLEKRAELPRGGIRGFVRDLSGIPVPDARVHLGRRSTMTDERGYFEMLRTVAPGRSLVAFKQGYSPAEIPGYGDLVASQRDHLLPVDLVLSEMASIEGWLVDAGARPCAGWRIRLLDAALVFVESREVRGFGQRALGQPVTAEEISAGERGPKLTREDGGFVFNGLQPGRAYRVRAWNERTLRIFESEPVAAGVRGHVLRLPPEDSRPFVSGVVLTKNGRLVEGARVRLTMVEQEYDGSTWMQTGQDMKTGADGRFEFNDVPRNELLLRFNASGFKSRTIDLDPQDDGVELQIEVEVNGDR